jgi:treponemal membrane protein, putative
LTEGGEGFTEGDLDLQNLSTPQTGTPVENINTKGDAPANTENNQTTTEGGK